MRVVVALGPGHDVRRPEQCGFGDAGHRAEVVPIGEQRLAEDVLADALDRERFGLRRAGNSADSLRKVSAACPAG
jgi:hypothetical protein